MAHWSSDVAGWIIRRVFAVLDGEIEAVLALDDTTGIPYIVVLEFEWHDVKAEMNLETHGVSFDLAKTVFTDPFAVERLDAGKTTARCVSSSSAWPPVLFYCLSRTPNEMIACG